MLRTINGFWAEERMSVSGKRVNSLLPIESLQESVYKTYDNECVVSTSNHVTAIYYDSKTKSIVETKPAILPF